MLADEMIQQSNAILQALPTDIMYIVIDRLFLEIETGMVIFPHTSKCIAEEVHRYTMRQWHLC